MVRLGHVDAHCAAFFAPVPAAAAPAGPVGPPPLAEEILQAYVMLLSGHFQSFCRDLYSECAQLCAAAVPADMQATLQAQFAAGLLLNTRNPKHETIREDFERFGIKLNLGGAAPGNAQRVTHLGQLNHWRNHVAHQKATLPAAGPPPSSF
jgi:hypothetical protein